MSIIALVENFSPEIEIRTRRVVVVAVPDFVGGDSETASEARASRHGATVPRQTRETHTLLDLSRFSPLIGPLASVKSSHWSF